MEKKVSEVFNLKQAAAYLGISVPTLVALLRGGEHICDVAILYPIHSLHSVVFLYQAAGVQEFEYPVTPENADYMETMNSFLNYVGMDSTFVHPNIIRDRAFSEDGTLFVKQEGKESLQKIADQ